MFCLFHVARRLNEADVTDPGWLYIAATLLSLLVVLKPRLMSAFVLSVLLGLGATLATLPVISNHTLMRVFLMTGMVIAFLSIFMQHRSLMRITPGDFYASFAPFGKAMLAIMYFYGVFHKLNTDFLNPDTSCAVTLWELYPLPLGMADALWAHYLAIYSALIIEAAIVVLLFIPRWKYFGLLLGLAFHFLLGINGYRFFVAFSSMTFALHFLFLPADFLAQVRNGRMGRMIARRGWRYPALMLGPLVLYAGVLGLDLMSFYYATLSLFILVSVGVMAAVAIHMRACVMHEEDTWRGLRTPQPLLYGLSVLYFINCAMPFIGLKTQQNLNMFSNLYTERGETNHIVITRPLYLFDFQTDIVRILKSNDPFFRELQQEGLLVPYIEFRRILSNIPDAHRKVMAILYERNGEIGFVAPEQVSDPDVFRPLSPWLRHWFHFQFVATTRPQVCNGHRQPVYRLPIYKGRRADRPGDAIYALPE